MKKIDLTGASFGRLRVIGPAQNQGRRTAWTCRCECSAIITVLTLLLRSGKTSSCGCLRADVMRETKRTHGMSRSPEEASYWHMMARCHNPDNPRFKNYGGRGIRVCDRWMWSVEAFLQDMGPRPEGTSLDRINVNDGYHPGNCRWATRAQQARNTTRTKNLTYQGRTMCIADWAAETGIPASVLYFRASLGQSPDRILRASR